LAKRGVDPSHPTQAISGSEVYVSPAEAARNRGAFELGAAKRARRTRREPPGIVR
jgi:hypothetical protein